MRNVCKYVSSSDGGVDDDKTVPLIDGEEGLRLLFMILLASTALKQQAIATPINCRNIILIDFSIFKRFASYCWLRELQRCEMKWRNNLFRCSIRNPKHSVMTLCELSFWKSCWCFIDRNIAENWVIKHWWIAFKMNEAKFETQLMLAECLHLKTLACQVIFASWYRKIVKQCSDSRLSCAFELNCILKTWSILNFKDKASIENKQELHNERKLENTNIIDFF